VRVNERGSVLMLVPAGFLVLMLLAAIAVDSAVAYQARNQLHDALAAAANDAVGAAVDPSSFYSRGSVVLDPPAVASVVCRSVAAQGLGPLHGLRLAIAVSPDAVRVTGQATVDAVFGRFVPGFGTRPVSSSADAVLTGGAQASASSFPGLTPLRCEG
jgi:hypothetical protein